MASDRRGDEAGREAQAKFDAALALVCRHPLLAPLANLLRFVRSGRCPDAAWAVAHECGIVFLHPKRRAETDEWSWVLAHCVLHYAFGHFQSRPDPVAWNAACDLVAARFLKGLGLGRIPDGGSLPDEPSARDEERLYRRFQEDVVPRSVAALSTAAGIGDLRLDGPPPMRHGKPVDWAELFAIGLRVAVQSAIDVAGGVRKSLLDAAPTKSIAACAREWFVSSYPLLGALARSFELVEDAELCARLDIAVAAIDEQAQVVYVSPRACLQPEQARFVLAHEYLHVGLRHLDRRRGRDPFLWNVACDFVINAWLVEMQIGSPPPQGLLYDPALQGMSAEEIYDRIAKDLRLARKLATLRGPQLGDMLEGGPRGVGDFTDLDAFYRSCLARGLDLHTAGRGLLPAGLVEEIRALQQPAIPWDVQLAQWFDTWFPALERQRSYARPSRRQASTPDIPRPRYVTPEDRKKARTFGVVLDTSGSMEPRLLGKGLGAIAAYAESHDVPAVRVVYCDAIAYDAGYLPPADIADRARVKGRGGTQLQPAIELLQHSEDFPPDGPILVITDGFCDQLVLRRPHAFLLPAGRRLPFRPIGPVFELA
ncbi:MAG: VWA-like domain-containing protein [Planctomycetes bacterium]|jgi:predicted metal-dependent peptidase|nr:VWA-like domain-containing protein [Planctomycetota bacterium]